MSIALANTILAAAAIYGAIGLIVGLVFVFLVAPRIDVAARGGGIFFRAAILPASIGLWPLVLIRAFSGRVINTPTDETDKAFNDAS